VVFRYGNNDTMTCRICLENEGCIISACGCTGTCGAIHLECLQQWIDVSAATSCEICKVPYEHPLLTYDKPGRSMIRPLRILTIIVASFQGVTIVIDSNEQEQKVLMVLSVCIFNISHYLLLFMAFHESNAPEQISLIWICTVFLAVVATCTLFGFHLNIYILFGCLCNMITSSVCIFVKCYIS